MMPHIDPVLVNLVVLVLFLFVLHLESVKLFSLFGFDSSSPSFYFIFHPVAGDIFIHIPLAR
jgi:hypothetical protein